MTVSATPAVAAPLDPAPGLRFDFGSTSSPLAEGYTRVAHTTLYTAGALMHDPVHEAGIVWQNVGYNQPPHTGFFLGTGMAPPPAPYLTTGSPLQARLSLRKDRLDVNLPRRDSSGILPSTVRAVADGKLAEPAASTLAQRISSTQ
ncbi:rhamnogalacturonan lyase family protein [Nonomuraea jabiensis]|uniref:rhamnogalacturonan lyase family protein n=1 Tax=Nonomuraea jabiensis TaxID=882448 RepID=UPI003687278F